AGDFHVHSVHSGDARPTLDEIATAAEQVGLDFVEISEHDTTAHLQLLSAVQARHPGVLLVPGIWWLPLTVTLGFWLYYERIMMAEEDFLQGKFGEPYLEWAGRTPPFLPRFSSWKPSSRRFSLKFVLKREYASWLGVITSFVLLELVLHWASEEGGMPGRFWLILEGVALVFYLIMRILRTRTRLLHQSDR
ncbi:MAG: hypothetical protein KC488_10090, partial [Candidatus Cloacimonetes bacterium]|nr:hypothetical protein [Candidatus Cloacimonadota bacterium]